MLPDARGPLYGHPESPTAHPEDVTPGIQHDRTTKHFGTVHYETGDGKPSQSITCQTEADFQAEIERGSKWVESEPFRYRGVWGERA